MSNFLLELNEILKKKNTKLNALYKDENNELIKQALKLCSLQETKTIKLALLRRIVDLKEQALINELNKLAFKEEQIEEIREKLYDFCADFYALLDKQILDEIKERKLLEEFDFFILQAFYDIGLKMNVLFKVWHKKVEQNSKYFKENFKDLASFRAFVDKNDLNFKNPDGSKCDRSYGLLILQDENLVLKTYAKAFKKEVKAIKLCFEEALKNLALSKKNEQNQAYYEYFEALKQAICEEDNEKVVQRWQEAEIKWMKTKSFFQIGHFLEYYEDIYTKSVAIEWDLRLLDNFSFDADEFRQKFSKAFLDIYNDLKANNERMKTLVQNNIKQTQLYISNPFMYFGADLNGLFSAQVVPNDEFVSKKCGKKIFAFIDFIYQSAKAQPFMKLSAQIFDEEFLAYLRNILFNDEKTWKKVYEISTIGHEFGHILFIDEDSETLMNESGLFKNIEEYKASASGQIVFFFNEDENYIMPFFADIISRSITLISRQEVISMQAYYCEALITLSLLFEAKVLSFDGKLNIDFSKQAYERFKQIAIKAYYDLALTYIEKKDAKEFLSKFCFLNNDKYLPKDEEARNFVNFYYEEFKKIGNEVL